MSVDCWCLWLELGCWWIRRDGEPLERKLLEDIITDGSKQKEEAGMGPVWGSALDCYQMPDLWICRLTPPTTCLENECLGS